MAGTGACFDHLIVSGLSKRSAKGWLRVGHMLIPCALGKTGRRARKKEGDGATPLGRHRIIRVLFRPDMVRRPRTALPVRAIRPNDGWCDAPADRNYNREVRLPYPAGCERMWRGDRLYDIVVVLDYNLSSRKRGAGSAIFMHVAREGLQPTEGCVALEAPQLARVLARLRPGASMIVA